MLPGRTWRNLAPTAQASGQWGVVTAGSSPGWAWVSVLIQGQVSKPEAQPHCALPQPPPLHSPASRRAGPGKFSQAPQGDKGPFCSQQPPL